MPEYEIYNLKIYIFSIYIFVIQFYTIRSSCIDEESEDENTFEEATHALAKAAHDTASVCSDPLPSYHTPRDSLDGRRDSFTLSRSLEYVLWLKQHHSVLPTHHNEYVGTSFSWLNFCIHRPLSISHRSNSTLSIKNKTILILISENHFYPVGAPLACFYKTIMIKCLL